MYSFAPLTVTLDLKYEIYLLNLWFFCIFNTNNSQFTIHRMMQNSYLLFARAQANIFIWFYFFIEHFTPKWHKMKIKTITRNRKLVEITI